MSYEFLEHTADVKFRAEGAGLNEMFISAAEALSETIRGDIMILEQSEKSFSVEGKNMEGLLYNFLEEFLFLLDAEDFLVSRIKSLALLQVPSEEGKINGVGKNVNASKGGGNIDLQYSRPKGNQGFPPAPLGDTFTGTSSNLVGANYPSNRISCKSSNVEKDTDNKNLRLNCVVVGDAAKNYKFTNDVKAVTYSDMVVREENGKFVCEVVLDV